MTDNEKNGPGEGFGDTESEAARLSDAQENAPRIIRAPEGLDVEQIMAEIRSLVQEKRASKMYVEPEPESSVARSSFGAEWVIPVGEELDLLRAAARLDLEGEPIRSHRPHIGKLIVAWKKFVRFWVRKYTDAIFLRQSFFNTKLVGTIEKLEQRIDMLEGEVEALRREVARLRRGEQKTGDEKKNQP